MFDSHIHSSFSGDSEMPPEEACKKAISLGLEGIAFTDHLDIDYPDFDEKFLIDFEQYSSCMDNIKHTYRSELKVLKGIEVGIQPHVIKETDETVKKYDFDFCIASIHIIERKDPYVGDYFRDKPTKFHAFQRYLEEILLSVTEYDNFDVIGHIGYIRRYCNYEDRTLRHADYSDIIDTILKTAISKGKGIEINTSGYRGDLNSPIPDFDIVSRYKELGGEILTIGSDAHFPEHIALNFSFVKDMLSNMGFKYLTHFENRKPVFDKI
jgi:histidinol-phosphatase (PHP family)